MTIPTRDEQGLLKKLRDGDGLALDFFYQRYSLCIYRKIKKMVKGEMAAEELLQDVFVKVWDKRHLIDPNQSFKSYLYAIAQNLVYDFYRKAARDEKLQTQLKALSKGYYSHVEEGIYLKETSEILNKAIDNLPSQQRLVFTLCKLEGESYKDVSAALGISISTINNHVVKATKKIQGYMSREQNNTTCLAVFTVLVWLTDVR